MTVSPAQKAILGILAAAAHVDGKPAVAQDWLEDVAPRHRLFADVPPGQIRAARQEATQEWPGKPRDAVWLEWAKLVPPEMAMATFELAVEAMLLDKKVVEIERKTLVMLARALAISPADFNAAVEKVAARLR